MVDYTVLLYRQDQMTTRFRFYCLALCLAALSVSCSPAISAVPLTSAPTQPVPPATASVAGESVLMQAGLRYGDSLDDAMVSFLDIVAFQAIVDEETESLEVVFIMRDVPSMAPRGLIKNVIEYEWNVFVYLDPENLTPADSAAVYSLHVLAFTLDPTSGINPVDETNISASGEPDMVPFDQLWTSATINNKLNESIGTLTVIANPDADTLTIRGVLPGITSEAAFSYSTQTYGGMKDQPDGFIPIGPANDSGENQLAAEPSLAAGRGAPQLVPAGAVRAYPGPEHYAGDILTFEIQVDNQTPATGAPATLTLDDNEPYEVPGQWLFNTLVLPLALDTSRLSGKHTLRIESESGKIKETYTFEVLPASERPAVEQQAAWQTRDIPCCTLHYISGTAAAQDIELLAAHFQEAAEDIATISGRESVNQLEVYFIDRMWGNGAFGGNGELVVSYTNRYFGPTVDMEGWETLARHEFTHALGVDQGDDGFVIYNEGLAVFLAGGHFKSEPLAERAAALFDLGYSVPVGQGIGQHELNYLFGAAVMTYIHESYGLEALWRFVNAADVPDIHEPEKLNTAIQSSFGISLSDFESGFQGWLKSHDPGAQLDDLRLTVELQDLRRQYQNTFTPPPTFIFGNAEDAAARPEYLPVVIRESRAPANIAVELMLAGGQQAIVDGRFAEAEGLIAAVRNILDTRRFETPLESDYLSIAWALTTQGYEIDSVSLQGDHAMAEVITTDMIRFNVELQKTDDGWTIL